MELSNNKEMPVASLYRGETTAQLGNIIAEGRTLLLISGVELHNKKKMPVASL